MCVVRPKGREIHSMPSNEACVSCTSQPTGSAALFKHLYLLSFWETGRNFEDHSLETVCGENDHSRLNCIAITGT